MKKNIYIYLYTYTHTHIYIEVNHFAAQQKFTQYCKLTIRK